MMRTEYLQNLRNKLKRRVGRLKEADVESFHISLIRFWNFLMANPILKGILLDLELRFPDLREKADTVVEKRRLRFHGSTEEEQAAFSSFLIQGCAKKVREEFSHIEAFIGSSFGMCGRIAREERFKELFLEPLHEYLDEHLDDQRAILALLRRYKHKCEMFRKKDLLGLYEEDTSTGEKRLGDHCYEYLHDMGIDFTIEPRTISGKPDLIAFLNTGDPLIADFKVVKRETAKRRIAEGFNQVYIYTRDLNEPFGYLIIYKTCKEDLGFALANQEQSMPFHIHNGKTIFIITIDICPHEKTASERGELRTIEITADDLVTVIMESKNSEN